MSHHTNLDEKIKGYDKALKYRISLVLEGNELDTYIIREVPIPEGDEAKTLTQGEIGQGQEDHC